MDRLARHAAALVAAVAGFYLGLIVGIFAFGLDAGAEAAPLLTTTSAGLVVGATLGVFDGRRRFGRRAVVGLAVGLLLGLVVGGLDPEREWLVAVIALLSQGLAWWSSPVPSDRGRR